MIEVNLNMLRLILFQFFLIDTPAATNFGKIFDPLVNEQGILIMDGWLVANLLMLMRNFFDSFKKIDLLFLKVSHKYLNIYLNGELS